MESLEEDAVNSILYPSLCPSFLCLTNGGEIYFSHDAKEKHNMYLPPHPSSTREDALWTVQVAIDGLIILHEQELKLREQK